MFEEFSGGYYKATMTVQPLASGPSIERGLYDFINREFYYKTNAPVTMRVGFDEGIHFQPSAENAMPTDVLGLPREFCDDVGVHPSAEDVSIFVLKPAYAYIFGQEKAHESFDESYNVSDTSFRGDL